MSLSVSSTHVVSVCRGASLCAWMVSVLPALVFLGEPFMEDHEDTLHDNITNNIYAFMRIHGELGSAGQTPGVVLTHRQDSLSLSWCKTDGVPNHFGHLSHCSVPLRTGDGR